MSGGIVKAGAAGLKSVLVFSYGLTTLFMYMVIAIRAGYFFSRPSEKERLELQLGMSVIALCPSAVIPRGDLVQRATLPLL